MVEDVSPQGIEDFLAIYQEMDARKDLESYDRDLFDVLVPQFLAAQRGSIFFAEFAGIRVATALVLYCGRTATYYYGASRLVHRNVMAPYLLQFEIMRKAKSLGCECYDLMGITPLGKPDNGWADISVFKRKLGGRELLLVPTQEYIYDPVAYEHWKDVERARRERRRRRRAEARARALEGSGASVAAASHAG